MLSPNLASRLADSFAYLDFTLPTVEENLALDEALLLAAEESGGGPVLRVWESPVTTVVLGASSRFNEDVEVEACLADEVGIARRSSGGGTVVIGPGALNMTVVLPNDAAPGLEAVDTAQAFVLERVAASIREAGLAVQVQGSGDLTLDGRKFAGSAQRRLRCYFLVHASLLYDFPLERVVRYTRPPRRQPAYRAGRTHLDFLTNLPLRRERLLQAIRDAWLTAGESERFTVLPTELVKELVATKFGDPNWVTRL